MSRILILRTRKDHRFLFEIPEGFNPQCTPTTALGNAVAPVNGGFVINQTSPFEFELTPDEMEYYRYFIGKLSFQEIAQRMAARKGISEQQAPDECLDVYLESEDCLAAIALI